MVLERATMREALHRTYGKCFEKPDGMTNNLKGNMPFELDQAGRKACQHFKMEKLLFCIDTSTCIFFFCFFLFWFVVKCFLPV